MKSNVPGGAEPLIAERSRLEKLLQSSEDWRALQQLRSRTERGEGLSTVSSNNLETMLVDALAENPFFGPYKSVCLAIERLTNGQGPAKAAGAVSGKAVADFDDLTRIRGVDGNLARRLKDLDITTFAEIAEWRSADIQRVSAELGLAKQIYGQNWIEQAALLALTSPRKAPVKPEVKQAPTQPATLVAAVPTTPPQSTAAVAEPDVDPNQLTLNFTRTAPVKPAPKPAPASAADLQPPPAKTPAAQAPAPSATAVPVRAAVAAPSASQPASNSPKQPSNLQTNQANQAPAKAEPANPQNLAPPAVARPVGPPPKPLVPWRYGRAPETPAATTTAATATPAIIAPRPAAELPVPPRPLVVTRATLDALPKDALNKDMAPKAVTPAPQAPASSPAASTHQSECAATRAASHAAGHAAIGAGAPSSTVICVS